MKKVIFVEDNYDFSSFVSMVIQRKFPDCQILTFPASKEAIAAVTSLHADFDVLLLDGHLGYADTGMNVLDILTPKQIERVVVTSGSREFATKCEERGTKFCMEKGFAGVLGTELFEHIIDTLKEVTG